MPDISGDSTYEFYELVWYRDLVDFPNEKWKIDHCLGVAGNYTSNMVIRILKENGQVIVSKPVWSLQEHELLNINIQAEIAALDEGMNKRKLGPS
jgi:hypothetical protein